MFRGIRMLAIVAGILGAGAASGMEAPIRTVTVYAGTAMVERELSVQPGRQHVELAMPANFAREALRLESGEGISTGPLALRGRLQAEAVDPREAALEKKLEELNDRKALLQVDAETAESMKALLARMTLNPGGDDNANQQPLDARGFAAILGELRKADAEARAAQAKIALQEREIDKQIELASSELDKLRSGRKEVRTLSFDVNAERAGTIRIIYPQTGAGWAPAYRAVLDTNTGHVRMQRQALLRQQTGDDWTNVKLKLSTGQPQMAVSGPEPSPWTLMFASLRPEGAPMALAAAAPAPEPMKPKMEQRRDADEDGVMEDALQQEFTAFDTAFATEFSAPLPVTLKSDGSETTLTLEEKQLDGKMRLRATPRLQQIAYLEVEAARPDGDWLPGKVQLVRDNDYVGETYWQPQSHEKLILPFGADNLVRITHQRTTDRNGDAGLLHGDRVREVRDVYTFTSNHRTALPLLVLDATPQANDDDIEVKMDFAPQPGIKDWEQRSGVMGWELSLAPKGAQTVETHYTVTWPDDQRVAGLP